MQECTSGRSTVHDLHNKICKLENFIGEPEKSNEKILEAIQMHWIEECD